MDADADRTERLQRLVDRLLVRDADAHAAALEELAAIGDERVVPHLVEVLVIDSIATDWARFGFPAVLRERDPPRYLDLPEVRWPGARDALAAVADPDFDSAHAWVEWESWYSQQSIDPLAGFEAWKLRLYRSYLPPVGGLLDAEPRAFDLQDVRWGNCDRSFLAALNAPEFVPGNSVEDSSTGSRIPSGHAVAERGDGGSENADGSGSDAAHERYLADDVVVFGFELDGTAYAVPRWVLFPHELMNATLGGRPVALTYCTLCNAPILYDRRVDGDVRTFGSSGLLVSGNKVMYDEETETLWSQHAGVPTAGHYLAAAPDLVLDQYPVTQTEWGVWKREHPDTLALALETGYDYDYRRYEDDVGLFRHYWNDEDAIQPGVERADDRLPEKASVYGIAAGASEAWVVPVDAVPVDGALVGEVDGRTVVAVRDATDDVAVYEAPPPPVERTEVGLVDATGTEWELTRDELRADGETRPRIAGRHGLWFAFRTQYDRTHVLGE